MLWDACTKIEKGDFDFYGTGHEVRDWLHVQDAARLLLTLPSHASSDAVIVNGGTGVGIPVSQIVTMLGDTMKIQARPVFLAGSRNPETLPDIWQISEKQQHSGGNHKISINEGIDEYVRWYRSGAL